MDQRWIVRITTTGGENLHWHKGGARHTLSPELGPHWVQHFKPTLFQVLRDGSIVPRGTPGALDIASVALEPAPDPG